jgi:hypothetical protein
MHFFFAVVDGLDVSRVAMPQFARDSYLVRDERRSTALVEERRKSLDLAHERPRLEDVMYTKNRLT